jgi:hypothetical protein
MVRKGDDAIQGMLDDSENASVELSQIKTTLDKMFNYDGNLIERYKELIGHEPTDTNMRVKLEKVENPLRLMGEIHSHIKEITESIKKSLDDEHEICQTRSYLITNPIFEMAYYKFKQKKKESSRNKSAQNRTEE